LTALVKTFHFTSDTEGWIATTSEPAGDTGFYPGVIASWRAPHKGQSVAKHYSTRNDSDPLKTQGGCLRMTARSHETPASENYWEWSGTFEDLGVPAGATISAVEAEYLYRVICFESLRNLSGAIFGAMAVGSGPFELRKSDGTLVDTFSNRVHAPARNNEGDGMWRRWPVSDASPYDPPAFTEYPIPEIPPSWGRATSASVAVPSEIQASSSSVKFRLRNCLPETAAGVNQWVRLKQDHVVITVTYSTGEVSTQTLTLVLGF
jgi:hypothetical protein